MATPGTVDLRSPLDSMLYFVPQGHEKNLKQAFYNAATFVSIVVLGAAVVAVYFVFEIFVKPLLWATLCGTVLYPFKYTLQSAANGWLQGLEDTSTPLIVGAVAIPLTFLNFASEQLGNLIARRYKILIAIGAGLPAAYLIYWFLDYIFPAVKLLFSTLYQGLNIFSTLWVWTIVIAYILALIFLWRPNFRSVLTTLAIPVWILLLLHLATVAGWYRIPIFFLVVILVALGYSTHRTEMLASSSGDVSGDLESSASSPPDCSNADASASQSPEPEQTAQVLAEPDQGGITESDQGSSTAPDQGGSTAPDEGRSAEPDKGDSGSVENTGSEQSTSAPATNEQAIDSSKPSEATEPPKQEEQTQQQQSGSDETDLDRPRPANLNIPTATSTPTGPPPDSTKKSRRKKKKSGTEDLTGGQGVRYIYGVIWACIVIRLWIHMGLVVKLVPILLGFWLLKKIAQNIGAWDMVKNRYTCLLEAVAQREPALTPPYVKGLAILFLKGDKKIIGWLKGSMDALISVFIILSMFFVISFVTVMMAVQIQSESMTLIQVTGDLVNETVSRHPELQQWFPETEQMTDAMDSMLNNAYLYGREWIAEKVRTNIGGDSGNVEKQVLELWDQLYVQWVAKNGTEVQPNPDTLSLRSKVNLSVDSVYNIVGKFDDIDVSGFMTAFQENIETVKSILESVWLVLKGNMNLIGSLLTTILTALLQGGTAILNFVISFIVFLTALFYLLSFSDNQYLPMKWASSLAPVHDTTSDKYGQAVESAIRGVFGASIKMSTFYGLYTWLTHTIFGLQIVYIPSALAALFGAIPFVGTYWAAVPGVIELLVHGEKFLAVLLFVVQILPMSVVDTAIYSDIKGGGHPYLTGLAVAGGIYYYGLEGAIIGPILLCVLLVAVNVYSTIMQGTRVLPATPASPLTMRSQPRERRLRFERSESH